MIAFQGLKGFQFAVSDMYINSRENIKALISISIDSFLLN